MAQQYQVDIVTKVTNISSVAKLDKAIKQLAANENKVATAANKAAGSQQKFGNAAKRAGGAAAGASKGVKSLGAAFAVATAKITLIVGAITSFTNALNSAFERDKAEQRLKNITGSTEEYKAALQAATDLSNKFGQSQTETTKALGDTYSRLSGLGYGLKEVTEIYGGFNTIALKSGVASEEAAGAFFQLSQALGSGSLQGDELRSILERMPQLAQALAAEMGVSASQVKKLGSEGKITGEVIYRALQKASEGGVDLGSTLTTQQLAFMQLRRAAEQAMVIMGKIFSPVVTAAAEQLGKFIGFVNDTLQYLAATHGPAVKGAMDTLGEAFNKVGTAIKEAFGEDAFQKFQNFLQNIPFKIIEFLVAGFVKLAEYIAWGAENLAKFITKLNELANSTGAKQLLNFFGGIAEKLGLSTNKVEEFKEKQAGVTAESANTLEKFSSLPQPIGDAAGKADELKTALEGTPPPAADVAEKAGFISESLSAASANGLNLADQLKKMRTEAAGAKQETSGIKKEAEGVERAFKKTEMVVSAELQEALNREVTTLEQVKQQNFDIEAAIANQGITYRQVNAEKQVGAQLSGEVASQEERAAAGANMLSSAQMSANSAIAQGASSAANLASQLERAAAAAASIGGGGGGAAAIGGNGYTGGGLTSGYNNKTRDQNFGKDMIGLRSGPTAGSSTSKKYDTYTKYKLNGDGEIVQTTQAERQAELNQQKIQKMNAKSTFLQAFYKSTAGTDWEAKYQTAKRFGGPIAPHQLDRAINDSYMSLDQKQHLQHNKTFYAEGGYVTGPTQAVVGEGGEPEYIIPSSKLDGAMQRYQSGMRGDSMIPSSANVSVNYSGSTVDMGGSSYINKGDVTGIVSQAVNQTLTTLQRSSKARLTAGLR